jgi:hypothetical protein
MKVVVLNRHGHRAPNAPFWNICPKDEPFRDKFGVAPEDLTRVGFDEEFRFGEYLRNMYPDLLGSDYNRSMHFFQACGEPRTLQSALAITSGAFPTTKKTPSRRLPHHPNLVPIYGSNQNREYLLNDVPCKNATEAAVSQFLANGARDIWRKHKPLMKHIMKHCGTTKAAQESLSLDLIVKILVDGLIFEHDFGLDPIQGHLTKKEFEQLRNVSQEFLFGKFYGTDEQQTYAAAEFPHFLVKTLDMMSGNAVKDTWNDNQLLAIRTPLNVFVAHREMIYGVSFFYDFRYYAKGMAVGEVPSGTSLIFEYLKHKMTGEVYIRVKMWTPNDDEVRVTSPRCKHGSLCSYSEFTSAYYQRVERTGRWDVLCKFPRPSSWYRPGVM